MTGVSAEIVRIPVEIIRVPAEIVGVPAEMIRVGSQVALIPTWFLAVYCLMVILTPPARWAWKRWGFATIWGLVTLSILGDLAYFEWDLQILGWTNYLFIWLAVHQLGFVWLDRTCNTRAKAWAFCAGGFLLLLGMTACGALAAKPGRRARR